MAFDRLWKYARDANPTTSFTCFTCSVTISTIHGAAMALIHSKTHPSSSKQAPWCCLDTGRLFYDRDEALKHITTLPALNEASSVFAVAANKTASTNSPDEPPFPESPMDTYACCSSADTTKMVQVHVRNGYIKYPALLNLMLAPATPQCSSERKKQRVSMVMMVLGLAIDDMNALRWCPLEEARPLLRELGLEEEIEARLDKYSPYHSICNLWLDRAVCNTPMPRDRQRKWHSTCLTKGGAKGGHLSTTKQALLRECTECDLVWGEEDEAWLAHRKFHGLPDLLV